MKDAQDAAEAAKDALAKATEDGVVTPEEAKAVEDANKALEEAKDAAAKAIDAVPADKRDELTATKDEIAALPEAEVPAVPAVNDTKDVENANKAIDAAKEAEKAAQDAAEAAKDALAKATEDGVVTPEEAKAVEDANAALEAAKDAANKAIDAVPADKRDELTATKDDIAALDGAQVPTVNDKDPENGVPDDIDAKIKTAEDAKVAADKAAADAAEDGVITQAEADKITQADMALEAAKVAAKEAIKEAPADKQTELNNKIDALQPVAVPEVNDKNPANGVQDTIDAKIQEAIDAKAAADKLAEEAAKDGNITQQERDDIVAANKVLELAKDAAKAAILDAPVDKQDELAEKINSLQPATVPGIDDLDGNGKVDSAGDLSDALDKVKAAEAAARKAANALNEANKDGVITPKEAEAVKTANAELATKKEAAQIALNELPDSDAQDALQTRLDATKPATVPTVNDKNPENGVQDDIDAKIKAAEDAKVAADKAAADAVADGVITQAEADKVTQANQALETAKKVAKDAIADAPADKQPGLTATVEGLTPATVPTVNDKNPANGVQDTIDAKIQKAIDAKAAADKAAKDAAADGVITQAEADKVTQANQALEAAKTAAKDAIADAPTDKQAGLTAKVEALTPATVPIVNDKNPANGVQDTIDAKIQEAVDAKAAADKAAKDAMADGVVTQAEADKVTQANQALEAAKTAAKDVIANAPADKQAGLTAKVNALTPATVPEVTPEKTPMKLGSLTVTDDDTNLEGTQSDQTVNYNYALTGDLDTTKTVRVQLFSKDNLNTPIATNTSPVQSGKTSYDGKFDNVAAGKEYVVKVDVVETGKENGAAIDAIGKQEASFTVISDEPLSVNDGAISGANNTVTLNLTKPVTSDHSEDVVNGNTATLTFGNADSDKVHILTDDKGEKIAVHNPKTDWNMTTGDDTPTSTDHADGWAKTAQTDRPAFVWNGREDAADVVIAADEVTDGRTEKRFIGNIGAELSGTESRQPQFVLDTKAGGNDYVEAKGAIGGMTAINTNEGDDTIKAAYFNGRKGITGTVWYDGAQKISMGDGNDTLEVTAKSSDRGVYQNGYQNASFYYTNAKVDMGAGDDTIKVSSDIITGSEEAAGNYFNLGSGNDKMIVGGAMYGENVPLNKQFQSSNIINLGKGNDVLQIAGSFGETGKHSLIISEDGSDVTFGNLSGYTSLMMGDGKDTVTLGSITVEEGAVDYLNYTLVNSDKYAIETNPWYKGFYDDELKSAINSKLAKTNIKVGSDILGAEKLGTDLTQLSSIKSRIDLGDGENILKVADQVKYMNYVGGRDSDTLTLNGNVEDSRIWVGTGTNNVTIGGNATRVTYTAGQDSDSHSTVNVNGNVNGGTYNFGNNGADGHMTVKGSIDNSTFNFGKGTGTVSELFVHQNLSGSRVNAYDGDDSVIVRGSLISSNDLKVDLGAGNNKLEIGNSVSGLTFNSSDGVDKVSIGLGTPNEEPYNQWGINPNATVSHSKFILGAGNDVIDLVKIKNSGQGSFLGDSTTVVISAGDGDDVINLRGIEGTMNEIYGDSGNDIIRLWGSIRGDNTNKIDGGNGYDKVEIGTAEDYSNSQFYLGYNDGWTYTPGKTLLQNIEEVVLNAKNQASGDTITVSWNSLTESDNQHIVKIRLADDVTQNFNTLELRKNWSHTTNTYIGSDRTTEGGVTYYTYKSKYNGDDWLYVDERIVNSSGFHL
ncbi:GA-like domain-containing protein [Gallibacterium anatis]|uniref:GA-like domain-containing protein n=1 Tax=Gallibacterium anatis TaxID=750 RepID=UPI0039C149EC